MRIAAALAAAAALFLEPCAGFTITGPRLHIGRPIISRAVSSDRKPPIVLAASRLSNLAAGVRSTPVFEEFSWTRQWYPMAFADVTDRKVPHRLELFGEPLVLWWDQRTQRWCAMSDSCPHRAAPLSEGRIDENGQIECPYHGWCFDGNKGGVCTKIPQASGGGDAEMLSRCSGIAYIVEEKQGLIWVYGEVGGTDLPDPSTIPICEALDDPRFCWIDVSRYC